MNEDSPVWVFVPIVLGIYCVLIAFASAAPYGDVPRNQKLAVSPLDGM